MDTFLFPEPNVPLLNHPHHPFHLPLTGNILRRESLSLSSSGQNVTQHLFLSLNVTGVIRFCVSSMDFFSSSSSSLFFLGVFVVIESDSRHDLLPLLLLFFLSSCSVCLLSFTCLPDEDGSTQWPSYMPQVYLIWDCLSSLYCFLFFFLFSLSLLNTLLCFLFCSIFVLAVAITLFFFFLILVSSNAEILLHVPSKDLCYCYLFSFLLFFLMLAFYSLCKFSSGDAL